MPSNPVPTGSPHLSEVLPQNRFICTYLGPKEILFSSKYGKNNLKLLKCNSVIQFLKKVFQLLTVIFSVVQV